MEWGNPKMMVHSKSFRKLASSKEEQRPDRSDAASHVGAAGLAHLARSVRSDAALRWEELFFIGFFIHDVC